MPIHACKLNIERGFRRYKNQPNLQVTIKNSKINSQKSPRCSSARKFMRHHSTEICRVQLLVSVEIITSQKQTR